MTGEVFAGVVVDVWPMQVANATVVTATAAALWTARVVSRRRR